MSEKEFLAEFLRGEIKDLKDKRDKILEEMTALEKEDRNVAVFAGLLKSPGVREYVEMINALDDTNENIHFKRNGFRYNLVESCNHPALKYIKEDIQSQYWMCTCLVCKNTVFRTPEDCRSNTVIAPALYDDAISIDDLREEYLDLYEESGREIATDIMVKKYNRINKKR